MLHFTKTFPRMHLVRSSEWFCFSDVLAQSLQQLVGSELEVLGVLQQVFHMFRFIAECREMYREQIFFGEIKRKVTSRCSY